MGALFSILPHFPVLGVSRPIDVAELRPLAGRHGAATGMTSPSFEDKMPASSSAPAPTLGCIGSSWCCPPSRRRAPNMAPKLRRVLGRAPSSLWRSLGMEPRLTACLASVVPWCSPLSRPPSVGPLCGLCGPSAFDCSIYVCGPTRARAVGGGLNTEEQEREAERLVSASQNRCACSATSHRTTEQLQICLGFHSPSAYNYTTPCRQQVCTHGEGCLADPGRLTSGACTGASGGLSCTAVMLAAPACEKPPRKEATSFRPYEITQPPERFLSSSSMRTGASAVTVVGRSPLLYLMQIELTQCRSSVFVAFSP